MATVAPEVLSVAILSRTALRRQQRKHTLSCLRIGIKQQQVALLAASKFATLSNFDESQVLLQSIAVHRADCAALQLPVH